MAIEISEMDGKIGGFIVRLACGLLGIAGVVVLVAGLVSWLGDSAAYASIWTAMVGDEPYCRLAFGRSVLMGGGVLWKMTPNGMLPALCEMFLAVSALVAALFNRFWMYCVVVALMFLRCL